MAHRRARWPSGTAPHERGTLVVRRWSEAYALNYHTLRVHSLKGLVQPIEAQVREALEAGAIGMARLLVRYGIEGTRVWGVCDDEVLAGVMCLSRRPGHEPSDAASLRGAAVLPRYRGNVVTRARVGAGQGWV